MSAETAPLARLATLSVDDFAPLVGERFRVSDRAIELRLERAQPGGPPVGPGGRSAFALEFVGPSDAPLDQRIHGLAHPGLGVLDLFLVPVSSDESGVRYEAVFS